MKNFAEVFFVDMVEIADFACQSISLNEWFKWTSLKNFIISCENMHQKAV